MTTKKQHKNFVSDMIGPAVFEQGKVWTDEESEKEEKRLFTMANTYDNGFKYGSLAGYDRALSDVLKEATNHFRSGVYLGNKHLHNLKLMLEKLRAENGK